MTDATATYTDGRTAPVPPGAVTRWQDGRPALDGPLQQDADDLTRHLRAGESLLAALPPAPRRDEEQARLAADLVTACRTLRERFIARHAEQVYDGLTAGRTRFPRLAELAFAAAERFPGLVPTRAELAAERALAQADKHGREIDQGIFFRGLLRSPSIGAHLMAAMRAPTPRARELLEDFRRLGHVRLSTVDLERRDGAGYLTVHNEHCLNAEDDQLIDDMETAVDLVLLDDSVRVGVLRGSVMTHPRYRGRRVFSAGINLKQLRDGRISFVDFLLRRELGYVAKMLRGILLDPAASEAAGQTVEKPWIAAVEGFAIGGGMQLLLVADRVIAADDAFFSLPAAQEGIVPGAGSLRLTRLTGARLARRIILQGRVVRATDPEAELLCDDVVPVDRVDETVEQAVRDLSAPAVLANRGMLHLAEEPPDLFRAYLAEFAYVQAVRMHAPDVVDKVGRFGRSEEASA